jgi:hypothetical protein
MSHSTSTLHVRDVTRAKVRAALVRSLAAEGWEPFDGAREMNEPEVRRFLMVEASGWVSVAGEDGEMLDDRARSMSKRLGAPVLTIFTWDGEAVVLPRCFTGGVERASFELPREAERGKDRRARVRCRALEPWLDTRTLAKLGGWLVLDEGPDEAFGEEEEGYTFVSEEDSLAAIGRVLGLEHVVVDAYDEDLEGGEPLQFRPTAKKKARDAARLARESAAIAQDRPRFKGRMPLLPPREGAYGEAHLDAYCLADYAARGYAVGWVAFEGRGSALASTLLAAAMPLLDALLPGLTTRKDCAAALKKAGAIDLCDAPAPDRKRTNVWLTLPATAKSGGPANGAPVPGVVGWSVPLPATETRRAELARVMHDAMTRALATEACIGACAIGAGRGRARAWTALPYEIIAGTDAGGLRLAWVRAHVRSPGWRVLVPKDVARRLPKKKPGGVKLWRGAAGVLVGSTAPDVFAQLHQDAEALERYLLDLVGTPRELRELLA